MNKLVCAVIAAGCISGISAYAGTHVDIMINGNYIKTEAEPVIEKNRVLAPVREIGEALGGKLEWNEKDYTVSLRYGGDEVTLKIGDKRAWINGKEKQLDIASRLIDNRTFIPVRFIAEVFGADVSWDTKTYTVYINKEDIKVDDEYVDKSYTSTELDWLAKIIHAEAQGEPQRGKVGVGNVVLNRVKSREFPNTIYDVIFDRKYGIQFTPIANGSIHNNPAKESYIAAKCALTGENVVGESLYFCNPSISTNFWISNNRAFFTKIGKHEFYL